MVRGLSKVCFTLSLGMAISCVSQLQAQKGGGKGGGGQTPPPSPPPVNYQLTWLDNIWEADWAMRAYDVNDAGIVAGEAFSSYSRTAFAVVAGVTLDLNVLPGATWNDLDWPEFEAAGWRATFARKVNEIGQIVGTAQKGATERAFVLEFPQDSPPKFTLFPSMDLSKTTGVAINDVGVVVAGSQLGWIVYTPGKPPQILPAGDLSYGGVDINNSGELVTRGGHYFAPGGDNNDYSAGVFIQTTNRWFDGINDLGQICGSRDKISGKNGQVGGPFRREGISGPEHMLASGSIFDFAADINNAGDVAYTLGGRGYLFTERLGEDGQALGSLALDALISYQDAASETEWKSSPCTPWGLNNRNSTGFGQICGISGTSGRWRSFRLTPQQPLP